MGKVSKALLFLFILIIISCDDGTVTVSTWEKGSPKVTRYYDNPYDSLRYIETIYYQNKKIEKRGRIVEGKPQGYWKFYYSNGKIHKEIYFKQGKPFGEYKEYDLKGNRVADGHYDDEGNQVGSWSDKDIVHEWQGEFVGGVKVHKWIKRDASNKIIAEENYNNNGMLINAGSIHNGLKTGDWTFYHPTHYYKICEGFFLGGKRNGDWIFYHPNGKLYSKGKYQSDQLVGEWLMYNLSGNLIFKGKVDSISSKTYNDYHKNGLKKSIGNYFKGHRDGEWVLYYESGRERAKGLYKKGERIGVWKYKYENSKPWMEVKYHKINEEEPHLYLINFWNVNGRKIIKRGKGVISSNIKSIINQELNYSRELIDIELTLPIEKDYYTD